MNGEKKYEGQESEICILYKKLSEINGNAQGKKGVSLTDLILSFRWAYLFICIVNHMIYFIHIAENRLRLR